MDVYPGTPGKPTPAAQAGLQSNDVILEFNGQPVVNAQDLILRVAGSAVGQSATFTYLRDGDGKLEKHTVSIVLGERPPSQPIGDEEEPKSKEGGKPSVLKLGMTLAELTPQLVTEKHLTGVRGLYLKDLDPNGVAADVRSALGQPALAEGDVITRINRMPVTTLADFQRVLSALKPGDPVVLNVSRYERRLDRVITQIVQFTYQ